ncbi:MAG: hypothetical protein H6672_17165 [Anaerolineaceae bacterium]|nr:hypothetical protein [Anaerolineaceae bacterium]
MQQINSDPAENTTSTDWALVRLVTIAMLVGFGVMMILTGMFYVKDLETLRNVPTMVWDFVCGRPVDSGITLPLLLTLGTLSILIGAGVWMMGRWRSRKTVA